MEILRHRFHDGFRFIAALLLVGGLSTPARLHAQEVIPHAQDQPPGPALSPAEAIAKMTVPEGFKVELVASEPDIVNPVAMTFDERGRIWITESLEYPRSAPGVGRDRIKVIEDKDGDGKADSFTLFAEGLNIPSGIAVGHGGVWVANAPDILFLKDTDGDGKADTREVVVSGFGRDDTHELPNSLTWGPDGWLYGWNGVFNQSHIKHRGKEYKFTCAIFRIHPKTRDFEVFCEGTSNPWGIAWNIDGSAFASACVIDHLWHLTETGYYHRQGGEYPPFTWKLGSIVDYKHQKAAYCGIHFFDSDAYPAQFRERLYMGNIHANGINVDTLERRGATYRAKSAPDFLSANDAWFMPVSQKTGPDGCLYILDWYDRYHCYQDARRDPEGIDRLKGRLYRVRYENNPRAPRIDLAQETDDQLIERLKSPNVYYRDIAQRLLIERAHPSAQPALQRLVLDNELPRKSRMHALWSLVGTGALEAGFHRQLLELPDGGLRAWGVRAAGNFRNVDASIREKVVSLAADPDRDVQLQVAIAARKLAGVEPMPVLLEVLSNCGDDVLIPNIVWQNLHPLLEEQGDVFVEQVRKIELKRSPNLIGLMPRVIDRLLGCKDHDAGSIVALIAMLTAGRNADHDAAGKGLAALAARIQDGEIAGPRLQSLKAGLGPILQASQSGQPDSPIALDAALLAASWKDPQGLKTARQGFASTQQSETRRLQALTALIVARDASVLDAVAKALADPGKSSADFRGRILATLGRVDDPKVAAIILAAYPKMEPELQPKAVELLTQRTSWSKPLVKAVAAKVIPPTILNVNQIRRLARSNDAELTQLVKAHWGSVREQRNPGREQVIAESRNLLRNNPGDPFAGQQVFKKLCAQCHKIYGEGQEVGPDITGIGRSDFEQLLSNVLDPSLVIGPAYQATMIATTDGRVLTGLVVEDNPQRVILKIQGGKQETISRDEVEEKKVSELSLMPEDIEKQLTTQELADLFSFLALDKPPADPTAKRLPGAPANRPRPAKEQTSQ
ncbi:PVC-type heme-binding CxxCH protein [Singulisphaera sp. Ch08]|uniref:PVC-type heme-binding CxxCH protein n=1 Tax=Singulisphaera sp. Ch08 TaxID=3120278 RepID=A0AAU7CBP4_9BACT